MPSGAISEPAGNGCSAYQSAATSGGPALLTTLVGTPGGIGYADLNDTVNDQTSGVSDQSELIRANVQNAAGTNYQSPQKLSGANCDFTAVTLPEGGAASGMVSLDLGNGSTVPPDTWASDNSTQHWNATDSGSQYPICGLTFDIVYTGLSTPFGTCVGDLGPEQRSAPDAVLVLHVRPVLDRAVAAGDRQLLGSAVDLAAGHRQRLPEQLLSTATSPFAARRA